ncbi:GLUG motif-containing protein [Arcobacter sp. CECT 8985]|uniref:two-partner secretion domain-containing protein n=1 Tax=Arcobacter sp. CECT 8985 TaxID=1935424 RepID=UPI00100A6388|nr:GLUG motif-containing protein [Arcobacter sp. CECT 8985]RXJ86179.1 filamentous hemagglutinin [Arcobacter sp. CECT 8985]
MKSIINTKNSFRILKGGKISLVVSALLTTTSLFSAPSGGVVTSGTANISQSGNITNINQSTNKASINWNKFNIASNETVNFNQPNKTSITLNRVIGNERSVINGALNANGQVWILNSNGVLFGKNAKVNTAGILATTKNLSDLDFQAGNYNFKGNSTDSVINQGTINIKDSGSVIFAANEVQNSGSIEAVRGSIHLVGADEYSINLNGNSLVNLKVDKGVLDSLVKNSGNIKADGGEVYLTTNAVDELLKGVVNNTGVIEANSLDDVTGKVELFAHGGEAQVGGTIEAKDGFIETSGKELNVYSNTLITANKWLLDPVNMTIESTGGSDLTGASVSATAIQNALTNADIELQADEDITVNENITWSDATQLKLTAGDEIYVNAAIENTNSSDGGVYFNAYNNFDKVIFGTNGKVIVNNVNQLQWINTALAGKYELGSDIDASDTKNWDNEAGFNPIGNSSRYFTGNFDGLGHTIDKLFINRPTQNYVGLFGDTENSTIKNIGLTNVDITGRSYVGGLVGYNSSSFNGNSSISNSYASGSVSGKGGYVGGLVGKNDSYYNGTTAISNSYASGSVSGKGGYVGGLVGQNDSSFDGTSSISNSYASGSVSGEEYSVGGLVGANSSFNGTSSISNSYWDIDTTGQTSSDGGGTGIHSSTATVDAFTESTYTGFDFTNTWYMIDGETRPFLRSEYSTNITNDHQLQLMAMDLTANYTLAKDITFTKDMWSNKGFNPIGNSSNKFTGNFDGLGHTIDKLFINRPSQNYVGLFGHTENSTIKNIGLTNVDITGNFHVGGLVGENLSFNGTSTIENSYASGSVSGEGNYVGGLVGLNASASNGTSTIENSYASGSVSGEGNNIGGLVGVNGSSNNGTSSISNSYASGSVSGKGNIVGGLVGVNNSSSISNSFWDIETSGQTNGMGYDNNNQTVTGLKTAQMQDINTFKNAGWNIKLDETLPIKNYPVLITKNGVTTWAIGKYVLPTTPNKPTPNKPTPNNQNTVNKIVTPINNKTITKDIANTVKNQSVKVNNFNQANIANNKTVVASAVETNSNKTLVSLSQLKEQSGSTDVRVRLSDNSIITLVNNAINLPNGIEQEFYISDKK